MPTINLAYIAEIALKYARKFAYSIKLLVFLGIISSLVSVFVFSFNEFYDLVQYFFNYASSGTSGETVSKMFGLMNCMGIIAAFNDTKLFLISSVSFFFVKIVYNNLIPIYYMILRALEPLVK